MSGIDVSPYLRRLALLSEVQLGLAFAIGIFPAAVFSELASMQPQIPWFQPLAGLVAIAAVSILVSAVAFYQDDDAWLAGVILALISGVGTAIAWCVATAMLTMSLGGVIVFAAGGFFYVLIRMVFMAPVFAGLVWLLRRFRRWLAPDSQPNPQV